MRDCAGAPRAAPTRPWTLLASSALGRTGRAPPNNADNDRDGHLLDAEDEDGGEGPERVLRMYHLERAYIMIKLIEMTTAGNINTVPRDGEVFIRQGNG
jgi:hypothetical protein